MPPAKETCLTRGHLDSRTKALYTKDRGEVYFAMYSTEDMTPDPTILYASKGARAVFDNQYANAVVAQYKDGVNYDGRAKSIDRATAFVRMQLADAAKNPDAGLGGQRNSGDAELYDRASRRRPSDALRNCLNNLELGRRGVTPGVAFGTSNILYIEPDKKRTDPWLSVNRLQLPLQITAFGSIAAVPLIHRDVKKYVVRCKPLHQLRCNNRLVKPITPPTMSRRRRLFFIRSQPVHCYAKVSPL